MGNLWVSKYGSSQPHSFDSCLRTVWALTMMFFACSQIIYEHNTKQSKQIFDECNALFILGMVRILGPEDLNYMRSLSAWKFVNKPSPVGLALAGTELASPIGQIFVDAKFFAHKRHMLWKLGCLFFVFGKQAPSLMSWQIMHTKDWFFISLPGVGFLHLGFIFLPVLPYSINMTKVPPIDISWAKLLRFPRRPLRGLVLR